MAFKPGNKLSSGRPKGSKNKGSLLTDEQRKQLAAAADGMTPLDYAASTLRDPEATLKEKQWACELLMPYMHQKLPTAINLKTTQTVQELDIDALKNLPTDKLVQAIELLMQLTTAKEVETE